MSSSVEAGGRSGPAVARTCTMKKDTGTAQARRVLRARLRELRIELHALGITLRAA